MDRRALIGYTGFVGGNLIQQIEFSDLYNSKNIEEIKNQEFDFIACAGAPAAMWIANANPEEDLANIQKLIDALFSVKAKFFVLLSTVAVYPEPNGVTEDVLPDMTKATAYGRNRRLLETFVEQHFSSHLILRLPGLFGSGLKKNAIYDLIHNNQVEKVDSRATYQFYNLANLSRDIERSRAAGILTLNIAVEPTSISEVAKECFERNFENQVVDRPAYYDFHSKYGSTWGQSGAYLYSKQVVFQELKEFVASEAQRLSVA